MPLSEIPNLGYPTIRSAVWSLDGKALALTGETGLWLYTDTLNFITKVYDEDVSVSSMIWDNSDNELITAEMRKDNGKDYYNLGVVNVLKFGTSNNISRIYQKNNLDSIFLKPSLTRDKIIILAEPNLISLPQEIIAYYFRTKGANSISINHSEHVKSIYWVLNDSSIIILDKPKILDIRNPNFVLPNSIKKYNVATGQLSSTFEKHTNGIASLEVNSIGTYAITTSIDTTCLVWDLNTGEDYISLEGFRNSVNQTSENLRTGTYTDWLNYAAWSPTGEYILGISYNKDIFIWNSANGNMLSKKNLRFIDSFAWSLDGKWLAIGSGEGIVLIFEIPTLKLSASLTCENTFENWFYSLAWSPDTTKLLGVGNHGSFQIWNFDQTSYQWTTIVDYYPEAD